jgi:hypothetical protein
MTNVELVSRRRTVWCGKWWNPERRKVCRFGFLGTSWTHMSITYIFCWGTSRWPNTFFTTFRYSSIIYYRVEGCLKSCVKAIPVIKKTILLLCRPFSSERLKSHIRHTPVTPNFSWLDQCGIFFWGQQNYNNYNNTINDTTIKPAAAERARPVAYHFVDNVIVLTNPILHRPNAKGIHK